MGTRCKGILLEDLTSRLLPYFKKSFSPLLFNKGLFFEPDNQKNVKKFLAPIIEASIEAWVFVLEKAAWLNGGDLYVWELDDNMLPIRFNKKLFIEMLCFYSKESDIYSENYEKILEAFSELQKNLVNHEGMLPKEMCTFLELNGVAVTE